MRTEWTIPLHDMSTHVHWLRARASRLVRDPSLADDLVQDTFLSTVGRDVPPSQVERNRWLYRILSNCFRACRRSQMRRLAREEDYAVNEGLPSSFEVVVREEAGRRVFESVLGLQEPYRNVLLLRYYESLSTREIALRNGQSERTVRRHVRQGLAELRRVLDVDKNGLTLPFRNVLRPAGAAIDERSASIRSMAAAA